MQNLQRYFANPTVEVTNSMENNSMQWNLNFPEESDDNSIPWNNDGLEFPRDTDDDSDPCNFGNLEFFNDNDDTNIQQQIESKTGANRSMVEEPPLKQIRFQEPYGLSGALEENHDDIDMEANDNEALDTDSHPGVLVDDGEQPGTSYQFTDKEKSVDSRDNEIMNLSDDSNPGILANDNSQPGTSRMAEDQNGNKYSNDNFSIDVKRIAFKKHTRFNFSDVLYHVQLKSKPGHSNELFKDVLEGLLHSLTKILQDMKSNLRRTTDRMLYLVSLIIR